VHGLVRPARCRWLSGAQRCGRGMWVDASLGYLLAERRRHEASARPRRVHFHAPYRQAQGGLPASTRRSQGDFPYPRPCGASCIDAAMRGFTYQRAHAGPPVSTRLSGTSRIDGLGSAEPPVPPGRAGDRLAVRRPALPVGNNPAVRSSIAGCCTDRGLLAPIAGCSTLSAQQPAIGLAERRPKAGCQLRAGRSAIFPVVGCRGGCRW
jgi:hypothetical protein